MTKNVNSRKRAWIVAAFVGALAIGVSDSARAQDPPDFNAQTGCLLGLDPSIQIGSGFCTPVWKLPLGYPELALGVGSGTVSYDASTTVLTVTGDYGDAYYLRNGAGNQYGIPLHFVVKVKIGNDGTFISGAGGACGAGSLDDYCVTGLLTDPTYGQLGVTGPVIKGRVEHAANKKDAVLHSGAIYDDFEFYINVTSAQTGDNLYANYMWPNMFTHVAFEAFGYNGGTVPYVNGNPFGASFTEFFQFGYQGITLQDVGFLFDPQNGRVSGTVTDYFSLTGIDAAGVLLTGPSVNVLLDVAANGSYSSAANLAQGDYTLTVQPPAGYNVFGSPTLAIHIGLDGANNSQIANQNFRLYSDPISASAFTTFSQASWGVKPKGNNAGALLTKFWPIMVPDLDNDGDFELVIGIPNTVGRFTVTESSPAAITDFLPQEGRPVPLTASYVDPPSKFKIKHAGKFGHHRKLGSLAGELLALELNVRLSDNAISKSGLRALHVASGRLAGKTVAEVLALGNRALGGDSFASIAGGTTLRNWDDLEDIIERINKNFQAGTTNNGYLIP